MKETAEIELSFEEDAEHTMARATLGLRGVTFTGAGRARRNPTDTNKPIVGEELASARALSDLAHKLLDAAAEAVSEAEGAPVHLRG
jgi:Rv2632c-like